MKLDKMLKEKLATSSEEDSIVIQSEKKSIDELWDIIAGYILSSAYKMLPSKEIKIGTCPPKNRSKSDNILKELRILGKLCHICIKDNGKYITEEERTKWSNRIREINEKLDLEIEEITERIWSDRRGKDLKSWWKVIHAKAQQEKKKEGLLEINKHIDKRSAAIQGELKHMLSNLLERSSNNVQQY